MIKTSKTPPADIIRQVRRNCEISDARHAGMYSICGLALRLRDLYKWEKRLDPWEEKEPSEVLDWIGEKEALWEGVADEDFGEITVSGTRFDPFQTDRINAALRDFGLYYGAGYVHGMKPTFFLADLEEKREIDGCRLRVLSREHARDLLTVPAMSGNGTIIFRQESAALFLWDKMSYINKSGLPALRFALDRCGITDSLPQTLRREFEKVFSNAKNVFVFHEVGEVRDTVFDIGIFHEILGTFAGTPVELLARSVKDLLADTNEFGTLGKLVSSENEAGLGFYTAFVEGFGKTLFPQIRPAFSDFAATGNWEFIKRATAEGFSTARRLAENMTGIFVSAKAKNDFEPARKEIEEKLVNPLLNQ